MIKVIHKTGYKATADEVRRDQGGNIIAVHIPLMGWKNVNEFDYVEGNE